MDIFFSFDVTKSPVRRVDSGPSPLRREIRVNSSGEKQYVQLQSTSNMPNTNVDVVLVNTPISSSSSQQQQQQTNDLIEPTQQQKLLKTNLQRSLPVQPSPPLLLQQQPSTFMNKMPSRRDFVCRSTGDELTGNYNIQHHLQQQQQQQKLASVTTGPIKIKDSTATPVTYQQIPPMTPQSQTQQHQQSHIIEKGYYSVPTNKDKAAAILGTITEDKKLLHRSNDEQFLNRIRPTIKTNLNDKFSQHPNPIVGGSHHQPVELTKQKKLIRGTPNIIPNNDTLRRRNSDPTNKIPLLEVNRGNDMYQSSTHINIAGHRFRKAARIGKAEKCASCQESDAFVNEGYRCLDCKLLVHTKCIQNGGVKTLQCEAKSSKRHRKIIDKNTSHDKNIISKYSGTREYKDSTDKIISDAKELQNMQDFITKKIMKMESDCENPSEVDRVFKQALREFKDNLVAQYSIAHKQNSDGLNIKYRDLITNFEHVMETCCGPKDDFPLTMGVNAFRGFMNEFMSSREAEKPKAKRKKDKRRKVEEHTSYNGEFLKIKLEDWTGVRLLDLVRI